MKIKGLWILTGIFSILVGGLGAKAETFDSFTKALQAPGDCNLPAGEKQDAKKIDCFAKKVNDELIKNDGKPSQSACMQGVRTAIEKASGRSTNFPWCYKASDAGKCLLNLGMGKAYAAETKDHESNHPKLVKQGNNWVFEPKPWGKIKFGDGKEYDYPSKLPPGTVLVYGGNNNGTGHIEVVTDMGNGKPNKVCSDYCSEHLRDSQTKDRWLIGIYLPPPDNGCGDSQYDWTKQ